MASKIYEKPWTEEEDGIIREVYPAKGAKEAALAIKARTGRGRCKGRVGKRAIALGLRRVSDSAFDKAVDRIIRENYRHRGVPYVMDRIRRETGRELGYDAVRWRARKLGLKVGGCVPRSGADRVEFARQRLEGTYGEPMEQVIAGYLWQSDGFTKTANILGFIPEDLRDWMQGRQLDPERMAQEYGQALRAGRLVGWEPERVA